MLNVHFLEPPEAEDLALLRSRLDGNIHLTTGQDLPEAVDVHVLVGGRPERQHLAGNSTLRALIVPFTGLPGSTQELLREFPELAVYNLHHNAEDTAEMAVALLMAAARFIVPFDQALRQNDWGLRYQTNPSLHLNGKTALILGFGQIGQRVGRVCHALGMQVLAVRRRPELPVPVEYAVEIQPPEALHDLLRRSHALVVTLPGTAETRGLVGAAELALMPPGGILVNVGRGPVVDQAALYQALQSKHLLAAGLDVWYRYPQKEADQGHTPPADYPFHELDNVVMSPHRGGASSESERLRMAALAELINALRRGENLPDRVDVEAGY